MATIGHALVGLALSRVPATGARPARAAVLMAAALLPDGDWLLVQLGLGDGALAHRGATHSLAAVCTAAAVAGLLATLRWGGRAGLRWAALVSLAVLSHPLLDMLTDGGAGIALAWPLSDARVRSPWRPLPVAPLGAGMLTLRGVKVITFELACGWPLLLIGLWPAPAARTSGVRRSGAA